jgi:D-amino-acid dehydrogenase
VHAYLSVAEAQHHWALQRRMSDGRYELPAEVTTGPEASRADVSLAPTVSASYTVRHEGVVDPDRLVVALADAVVGRGCKVHEHTEVTGFRCDGGLVRAVTTTSGDVAVSAVVIAGGSMSRTLTSKLGYRLPLQAGKGYSFSVDLDNPPEHPLYLGDKRIVATPINGTTRLAGTMEFSGHNRALDWRRIVAIARASRHYLGAWYADADDLIARIRDPWVGGRPMLPDGLPVIDKLPAHRNAYIATGHGMLGVTLAPATGRGLVDYMVTGNRPVTLAPFSFARLAR